MTASLPMYDRAETAAANDRLWAAIRDELRQTWRDRPDRAHPLPDRLSRPDDLMAHWLSPNLTVSQTCGLPYRTRLAPHVTLVGTPDYCLPGCPPGYYNSVLVVRADDDRNDPALWPGMVLACNGAESQSGWAAPEHHLNTRGLTFGRVALTGRHRRSAEAVAAGRADIAAIDAQTWRMIERWDGVAERLREVARTEPTPGLPCITAAGRDARDLFVALAAAIDGLAAEDRATLDLHGFVTIPRESYEKVPTPPFPKARASVIG